LHLTSGSFWHPHTLVVPAVDCKKLLIWLWQLARWLILLQCVSSVKDHRIATQNVTPHAATAVQKCAINVPSAVVEILIALVAGDQKLVPYGDHADLYFQWTIIWFWLISKLAICSLMITQLLELQYAIWKPGIYWPGFLMHSAMQVMQLVIYNKMHCMHVWGHINYWSLWITNRDLLPLLFDQGATQLQIIYSKLE